MTTLASTTRRRRRATGHIRISTSFLIPRYDEDAVAAVSSNDFECGRAAAEQEQERQRSFLAHDGDGDNGNEVGRGLIQTGARHPLVRLGRVDSRNGTSTAASLVALTLLTTILLMSLSPGVRADGSFLGIPGTTQTINGYDTELGTESICWRSSGVVSNESQSQLFANYLIKDFRLVDATVDLLPRCPDGNALVGHAPTEWQTDGHRLRTGVWHNYTLETSLDLTTLGGTRFVSDVPPYRVSFQVVTCALGVSGFCSPFIHDEANNRLAAMNISQSPGPGESHGSTHVHSPRVFLELPPELGPVYEINVTVPMIVDDPGEYFTIVAVQMFVANGTESVVDEDVTTRYDMANALTDDPIIRYQAPATILRVTRPVQITCWVAIGIASCIILYLFFHTVKYRQHQVLRLSQAPFLIVFLLAALVATLCSAMFEPSSDINCKFGDPLVLMSLQLFFAITIGRLWRINSVISPLLIQTLRRRNEATPWTAKVVRWTKRSTVRATQFAAAAGASVRNLAAAQQPQPQPRSRSLRKQIPAWHLTVVIA